MLDICTVVARNYLAHARVLAASFIEQHPGGRCFTLILDAEPGEYPDGSEPFTVVRPEQLGIERWDVMRSDYDILELSTAVKPWLLRWMLEHHGQDGVAYMDPDILVLGEMTELQEALDAHQIVLTPHVTTGMPRDGRRPAETDILRAGMYNLGFIAVRRGPETDRMLDWWATRLATDCRVAVAEGLFVDQRWVDFFPSLVDDLRILRHPAYNVAYWNLYERRVEQAQDGTFTAQGQPVRFFHFSGYDTGHRGFLSKHQDRVPLNSEPIVSALCGEYAKRLEAAGLEDVRDIPYGLDRLPSGGRLTPSIRRLYREGLDAGICAENLFDATGEADFLAWLASPDPKMPLLTRLQARIWAEHVGVHTYFPDPQGADKDAFLYWWETEGPAGQNIPQAPKVASTPTPTRRLGVNLAGYLRAESGVGEVARQLTTALDSADVPVLPMVVQAPASRQAHGFADAGGTPGPYDVNIVCVNADQVPEFARDAGSAFFADRYTIGVWWWETSDFPERFAGAFDHVDEVWAGSRFVADTLSAVSPVPVVHVPVALELTPPPPPTPGAFGIPPQAFSFLFSFDYHSVFARKNPLGVVEAYTSAFGPDDGAVLVLKCINQDAHPDEHHALLQAIAARDDILLVDRYLGVHEKNQLTAACDVYVSLHRSEGFGLTMAEAMLLGKPVIATGYSGNLDFTSATNSYIVDHTLVPVGDEAAPYDPDGVWAEPDLEHAARLMRHVFDHPDEARRRGSRGAEDVRRAHSPEAVATLVRQRLVRVSSRPVPAPPQPAPAAPAEPEPEPAVTPAAITLARLVEHGPRPIHPPNHGRVGNLARRLMLRLIRPFTTYQHTLNTTQRDAIRELELRVAVAETALEQARLDGIAQSAELRASLLAELRRQRRGLDLVSEDVGRLAAGLEDDGEDEVVAGEAGPPVPLPRRRD